MNDFSGFDHFLQRAKLIPLLTASEELILARKVQAMMQLQEAKPDGPYTKAERGVMARGRRARDRFVTANLRLVASLALKYRRKIIASNAMDESDLLQEGMFGLHRAVEMFDPERGYKFSTYAYWWIRQSIARGVHAGARSIRLPIHISEKLGQLRAKRQDLSQTLDREPTRAELSEAMGWDREALDHVLTVTSSMPSLDQQFGDDGSCSLIDAISGDEGDQLDGVEQEMQAEHVREMLGYLCDADRVAIELRFGFAGEPQTLAQMAERLGCSRETARHRVDRGMRRLRLLLAERSVKEQRGGVQVA